MAFLGKVGKIFRQSCATRIGSDFQPSIFQTNRLMSSSKVLVGGLSYGTDDWGLRGAFTKYGEVVGARVMLNRDVGRTRGEDASSAIRVLDRQDLHGRCIRVNYFSGSGNTGNDVSDRLSGSGDGNQDDDSSGAGNYREEEEEEEEGFVKRALRMFLDGMKVCAYLAFIHVVIFVLLDIIIAI